MALSRVLLSRVLLRVALLVVAAGALSDDLAVGPPQVRSIQINSLLPLPPASFPPSPPTPCYWCHSTATSDPVGLAAAPDPSGLDPVFLWVDLVLQLVLGCIPSPAVSDGVLVSSACPRLHCYRAAFKQADQVHHGATSSGADSTTLHPPGYQHRASSCSVGDEFSTYSSVAWCGFHRRLRRPYINRRSARSSHPAVLASWGETSAYRRRVRLRCHRCLCCNPADGPICNTVLFV
jgi:hypothetical protein